MVCERKHGSNAIAPYKTVTEYPLPGAMMTHEMAFVTSSSGDLVLISQQMPSRLLKIRLDKEGRPLCVHSMDIGSGKESGIHGLTVSVAKPGCVWATLEDDNEIVLLDPSKEDAQIIVLRLPLPKGVSGPHALIEHGDSLYTTCKQSGHVVKLSAANQAASKVYDCHGKPTYVAVHPISGDVYASLDQNNKLVKINATSGKMEWIDMSPYGSIPLAVIAGPDSNLWFTMLGGPDGTFGRIDKKGNMTRFSLPRAPEDRKVGLIHVAFDDSRRAPGSILLWLLASTGVSTDSLDAVFTIVIQDDRIVRQETVLLPTHADNAHRVVRHKSALFVTELGKSTLARITGAATGLHLLKAGAKPGGYFALPSETSDAYGMWGLGTTMHDIHYKVDQPATKCSSDDDQSMVAWWKLDEGQGSSVADSSGNRFKGTIAGLSYWDGGLTFGGSQGNAKVSFGTGPSLSGTTDFSIHAYVKSISYSEGVILQQRSPANRLSNGYSGEYRLSLVSGKPKFMLFGTSGHYQFDFAASVSVCDNKWHRVVAVREGNEGRIYVDGELVGSQVANQVESLDKNIPVFMGWDARDSISYFNGTLKDVKLFRNAVI